jgi:hypothetical protein
VLDLQVPLLAAKALLLLLLFAFIYSVVRRSVGDLRAIPEDESFVPGGTGARSNGAGAQGGDRNGYATLVVEDSDVLAPNTRFPIVGGTTSIGRSAASDIVLKNDDYASGHHARLTRHGGLLYVEDTESTNGTYVNGRKAIGATPLRIGDRVRVGSTTFRYSG